MSAWVVSKTHIDLMVRAAMLLGRDTFQWWDVDDAGEFVAWRSLDERAESHGDEEQARRGLVSPSQFGQILVTENVRSVGFRYSEPGRAMYYGAEVAAGMEDVDPDAGELPGPCDAYYIGPYVYANPGYTLTPAEVFKAVSCYEYQSCETDEWRGSEAYRICQALIGLAVRHVDGYEDAPYGWEDSDLEGRALEFSRRII